MSKTIIRRETSSRGVALTFCGHGHAEGMRFNNESEFEDFVTYLNTMVVLGATSIEKTGEIRCYSHK